MNKREIILPFLFITLASVFLIASVFVFFSKGKSKYWIGKKIKIGGILLTLTASSNFASAQRVMCYDQSFRNQIRLQNSVKSEIEINLRKNSLIYGIYYTGKSSVLTFYVTDSLGKTKQIGEALPSDGKFNEQHENFLIKINPYLKEGSYFLTFYTGNRIKSDFIARFKLIITH